MTQIPNDEQHQGCRRHSPFFEEECSLCAQVQINFRRQKRIKQETENEFKRAEASGEIHNS